VAVLRRDTFTLIAKLGSPSGDRRSSARQRTAAAVDTDGH